VPVDAVGALRDVGGRDGNHLLGPLRQRGVGEDGVAEVLERLVHLWGAFLGSSGQLGVVGW
jgi:hypothetical protein